MKMQTGNYQQIARLELKTGNELQQLNSCSKKLLPKAEVKLANLAFILKSGLCYISTIDLDSMSSLLKISILLFMLATTVSVTNFPIVLKNVTGVSIFYVFGKYHFLDTLIH